VVGNTTGSGYLLIIAKFLDFFVGPFGLVEVYLYFGERFALCLGHVQTTEQSAGQASDRVDDEVGGRAEGVGHRLVSGDHESGRDRDGHHDGRVGQGPGVGREVLALDDGQQGHEADVDEELGAGYGQEQR